MRRPRFQRGGRGSNQYQEKPGGLPESSSRASVERLAGAVIDLTGPVARVYHPAYGSWQQRVDWAAHTTDTDHLRDASQDGDPMVRAAAAANPRLPSSVAERMGADLDSVVRTRVAGNLSTPPWVLANLVFDSNQDVRAAAAANPACPPGAQHIALVDDPSPHMHYAAIRHPLHDIHEHHLT